MFNSSKRTAQTGFVALAGLFLVACTVIPFDGETGKTREASSKQVAESGAGAAAPASSGSELPEVDLDGDLLYQVLLGEIAARRGDTASAAEALLEAAKLSRDSRLARRATQLALDAGRFGVAMESASLWVELRPGQDRPVESLALIMVEQGRIKEAESRFAELLSEKTPDERGTELRRIARMLGQLSNKDHALAVMERLVTRYEDDADAHFAAAFLADRVGEGDRVLESLERALALRPGWQEAALAKIGHLIRDNYPRERVDSFARQYLESSPKDSRVRLSYARYLLDQGDNDEALEQFKTVLKHDPENSSGLIGAGLLSVQKENYREAREYFMRHLETTPDNDQVRLYLGEVAEERERWEEAAKWYREISRQQQRFDARLRLGPVLHELEGLEAAMEHLDAIDPDDEQQFVRLVLTREMVLREAQQLERAKSMLDDAVARYPGNSELRYARGLLAARLNRISEHEEDMRALLEEDPNNAHALNALGYTLADATDRTQEAYELIKKALSLNPDSPFILDSMGWVHYRMGNNQEAIEYLEKALAKRYDAEIAAHLGEVLWVSGNKDRAREVWERAKREHPDNHVLIETLERFLN